MPAYISLEMLLHHNLCTPSQRIQAEQSSTWDCSSCADLTNSQRIERITLAQEAEMINVTWHPTWEAADLLFANPDFKEHTKLRTIPYKEHAILPPALTSC
eukprot:1155780-Pelagomonas_calceolata.AAC.1